MPEGAGTNLAGLPIMSGPSCSGKRALGRFLLLVAVGLVAGALWEIAVLKQEVRDSGQNATVYKCIGSAKAAAIDRISSTSRATLYAWASAAAVVLLAFRFSEKVASKCHWDPSLKNACAVVSWALVVGAVIAVTVWAAHNLGGVRCRPVETVIGLLLGSIALMPVGLYFACRSQASGPRSTSDHLLLEADVEL